MPEAAPTPVGKREAPHTGSSPHVPRQTVSVIVQDEGADAVPVKVLNCDTISQVKEKIIDQVYRTQPCSRWPKADSVVLGEQGPHVPSSVPWGRVLPWGPWVGRWVEGQQEGAGWGVAGFQELGCVLPEWRPGSTAQILSDLDLTSQREGRWKRVNTLMHYNVSAGGWAGGGPHPQPRWGAGDPLS